MSYLANVRAKALITFSLLVLALGVPLKQVSAAQVTQNFDVFRLHLQDSAQDTDYDVTNGAVYNAKLGYQAAIDALTASATLQEDLAEVRLQLKARTNYIGSATDVDFTCYYDVGDVPAGETLTIDAGAGVICSIGGQTPWQLNDNPSATSSEQSVVVLFEVYANGNYGVPVSSLERAFQIVRDGDSLGGNFDLVINDLRFDDGSDQYVPTADIAGAPSIPAETVTLQYQATVTKDPGVILDSFNLSLELTPVDGVDVSADCSVSGDDQGIISVLSGGCSFDAAAAYATMVDPSIEWAVVVRAVGHGATQDFSDTLSRFFRIAWDSSLPGDSYTGKIVSLEDLLTSINAVLYPLGIGIGIFFIVVAGYKLMTSEGNPQLVKEAQEQLTSAIVGLIFILLSVTIMRVIISSILGG